MFTTKEPNLLLRRLGMAVGILVLIGGLPIIAMMAGTQFLPSPSWVADSLWLALGLGAAAALLFSLLLIRGRTRDGRSRNSLGYLTVLAFSPLLFGALGSAAVFAGGPMIYAALFGAPTELQYEVKRTGSGDSKCRNQIELRGLPILNNRLCGFPKDFTDTLRPGQSILVSGNGSALGIFVTLARATGIPLSP
jgi:hypothetical protein